ncbi:hypothetical protein KDM41_13875, partial [bacterium]|nr:hypothetical protein [bacterium]
MSGHRTVRAAWAAVLLAGVAGTLAPALAQVPPGHRLPPPDPSGPPPMAAPSAPDTAVIAFTVPDSLPAPTAVHAVQDSLDFGGLLHLVWDYPAGTATADLPAPASDGTWLEPAPTPRAGLLARLLGRDTGLPSLDELPPAAGERVVRSYRVFRREPLRVAWGDDVSGVITVRGQTADAEQTATIRQPRPLRWRPWTLVALLAGVLLLALLLWL